MTHTESQIKKAYQRSGLAFLGVSYAKAMRNDAIRTALECVVKSSNKKGPPGPVQQVLI